MPRAPRISETQEHRVIAAYFRKIGLGGTAVALHLRNERHGDWQRIEAARMGVRAGVPDWVVLNAGRAIFIEIKPRGWRARREKTGAYTAHERRQLAVHDALRRARCPVEICETLDEVLDTLRRYGVTLRTESPVTEAIRRGFRDAAE